MEGDRGSKDKRVKAGFQLLNGIRFYFGRGFFLLLLKDIFISRIGKRIKKQSLAMQESSAVKVACAVQTLL